MMTLGDCYEAAVLLLTERGPRSELVLVHGRVMGQGPVEGVEFGHAWVEGGGWVLDHSNGGQVTLPMDVYYRIGQIDEEQVRRYTFQEMVELTLETDHYGPWEMSGEPVRRMG